MYVYTLCQEFFRSLTLENFLVDFSFLWRMTLLKKVWNVFSVYNPPLLMFSIELRFIFIAKVVIPLSPIGEFTTVTQIFYHIYQDIQIMAEIPLQASNRGLAFYFYSCFSLAIYYFTNMIMSGFFLLFLFCFFVLFCFVLTCISDL